MYACHSESWESSWTVWRSWESTHNLCKLALLGLYYNLQPVPVTSHHSNLFEDHHHHLCAQEITHSLPRRLPSSGPYTCHHSVPGTADPSTHP